MVSWAADGTIAGYDPVTKRLKKGLYHLASPGSVDLNGVTRISTPMGDGLNATLYPNHLQATATLTFTSADFTANPGKKGGVGLIIVPATAWAAGHVPTPSEIFAVSDTKALWRQRANTYVTGPITGWTFEAPNPGVTELLPNQKYWVLLYPSAIINPNATWSKTNDAPLAGSNINTVGRALSFWSDRTPAKPTISSPPDGAIALAGSEFALRLNPADPDEVTPEDAAKYNDDVNGVQFQYRAAPTADIPSAEWLDLPFDWQYIYTYEGGSIPIKRRDEAWNIRGSRNWYGLAGTPYHEALVANLGCPVVAGAGDTDADLQPGKAALSTGDWQIRGRTFSYGHPYPNSGTKTNEPGPLGINPATTNLREPLVDVYPDWYRSDWSDPITVHIPAQVPPAIPLSPIDSAAVSGNSTRLRWQYRNTHQPPRAQFLRTVQIRKVGDPTWSTVFSGISADAFVDLPWVLDQDDIPPMNLLANGQFEAGTTEGWTPSPEDTTSHVAAVIDVTRAHSGAGYIRVTTTGAGGTYEGQQAVITLSLDHPSTDYLKFTFDGWAWLPANQQSYLTVQMLWYDEDGNYIEPPIDPEEGIDYNWPYLSLFFTLPVEEGNPEPGGWTHISEMTPYNSDYDRLTVYRPPGAAKLVIAVVPATNITDAVMLPWRFDDLTLMAEGTGLDSFTIEATNQYEWRVQVTDADNITSGYSTPARFWAVPSAGSGGTVVVPASTVDGATLGCGKYTAEIYRRGGRERVGVLSNVSYVDWGRVRDDISSARVDVRGWDLDCGNLLAKLQTWAYELVLWRDNGFTVDRVWEGPLTLLTYETDKVTIHAKDVMAYPYRRIIKQRMSDAGKGNGTTVVDRAMRVIQNVMAADDPNVLQYLQVLTKDDDAMQYRSTPAYSRTAFEEVDDMAANSGLDYTAVGRAILLWGTKHRIGTLPELRDADLGASPIVSEYGMSMANVWSVSDGNGVHGEAVRTVSGNDPIYGLVEKLSSTWATDTESETGTYTEAGLATTVKSFEEFAERSISDSYPPPVVVRIPDNTSLNPDTVLSIQQLVPGVVVPLRSTSTLRTVKDTQKLDKVAVVCEGGNETISITLSPFSRDDAAVIEGEEG